MLKTLTIFLGLSFCLYAATDLEIDLKNKSDHRVVVTKIEDSYSILSNVDIGEDSEIEPGDSYQSGITILLTRFFTDQFAHKGLNKITFEVIDDSSQEKKEFSIYWDRDCAKATALPGYIIRTKNEGYHNPKFEFVLLSEPK
jgi:hypothetical protein